MCAKRPRAVHDLSSVSEARKSLLPDSGVGLFATVPIQAGSAYDLAGRTMCDKARIASATGYCFRMREDEDGEERYVLLQGMGVGEVEEEGGGGEGALAVVDGEGRRWQYSPDISDPHLVVASDHIAMRINDGSFDEETIGNALRRRDREEAEREYEERSRAITNVRCVPRLERDGEAWRPVGMSMLVLRDVRAGEELYLAYGVGYWSRKLRLDRHEPTGIVSSCAKCGFAFGAHESLASVQQRKSRCSAKGGASCWRQPRERAFVEEELSSFLDSPLVSMCPCDCAEEIGEGVRACGVCAARGVRAASMAASAVEVGGNDAAGRGWDARTWREAAGAL